MHIIYCTNDTLVAVPEYIILYTLLHCNFHRFIPLWAAAPLVLILWVGLLAELILLAPFITWLQRWNILVSLPARYCTQFMLLYLHPPCLL